MRTLQTNNHPVNNLRNGGLDPVLGIDNRMRIVGEIEE